MNLVAYKIKHIPSGKLLMKGSSITWKAVIINEVLSPSIKNKRPFKLEWALTDGYGHTYNTKKGAENFLKLINEDIRDQFEIIELKFSDKEL